MNAYGFIFNGAVFIELCQGGGDGGGGDGGSGSVHVKLIRINKSHEKEKKKHTLVVDVNHHEVVRENLKLLVM